MTALLNGELFRRGLRGLVALGCVALVAACSTPGGAGLARDVLAQPGTAADGTPLEADFAIEPVTRDSLPVLAAWPMFEPEPLPWPSRVDQPDGALIHAGDRLDVVIWDNSENSLLTGAGQRAVSLDNLVVSPSGRIFLPYVGQVRVEGMAPETARDRIEEMLLSIVPAAQVVLNHSPGAGASVALVSGVSSPGRYPLAGRDETVMEILAQGGGIGGGFVNPQIRLIRGDTIYGTSVARLLDTPSRDAPLVAGDRLYVEEDERTFLSLGAAGSQAVHVFPSDHLTALEALAVIGGVQANRADPEGVLILRTYPSSAVRADRSGPDRTRVVFTIDLTTADGLFSAGQFRIQAGDLVYASESPLIRARDIISIIGSAFTLGERVAN